MNPRIKTLGFAATVLMTASALLPAEEPTDTSFPGESWIISTPAREQVDAEKLQAAVDYFASESGEDGVSEMMIIRHGRVIWQGDQVEKVHHVWSCTKSFGALVAGLLFDEEKISVDDRIADILPVYREHYPELRIRHLLSLTMGAADQDWENMDEVRPPLFPPGEAFHYASGINILSRALTKVAGEDLDTLFKRRIAGPIGLKDYSWKAVGSENGIPLRGMQGKVDQGVEISASGMARLGLLLLEKGKWDGKQLLSEKWLEMATRPQAGVDTPLFKPDQWYSAIHGAYGYMMWVNGVRPDGERLWPDAPDGTFAIQGNRNNICWILPEWDMVVVRLGKDKIVSNQVNRTFLKMISQSLGDFPGETSE